MQEEIKSKMKKYFLVIVTTLLFTESIYSQSATVPDEVLSGIDEVKEVIKKNIGSYQKKEKFKNSTGYNRAYFKGQELQLISVYYKDTITEKNVEWYFQHEKLIYSQQLWTDIKTKDTLDYERFYLNNERLIAWLKFNKKVDTASEAFRKVATKMRDYIGDLKLDNMK